MQAIGIAPTGDDEVTGTFHRTERTIALSGFPKTEFEVRTYTRSNSAAAARIESRAQALSVFSANPDKEILGLESVVEVPGVIKNRLPEVLVNGRWLRIHLPQAPTSDA